MDDWALAAIAAVLLAFAAASGWLQRWYVTAAMFFVTAGLLAGPVLGLLDLGLGGEPVKLLAEVTLTLVLFADASRISLSALRNEFSVPLRLLGIGLPLTIVAGALAGVALLPGVGLAEAFLLAVILACTDAALGQAVVTDKRLPSRIRQGLNVESGLNDGLCVPLFWIALGVAQAEEGVLTDNAALRLVLEEIGYGVVGGAVAGAIGVVALRTGASRGWAEGHWVQILTAATAFLAAGIATALHGSFFIAAFVGGLVFGSFRRADGPEVTHLIDEGGELLNAVTLIVFGAAILGPALDEITWQVVAYALLSLTVVRMVPVALAMLGTGARRSTVAFLGWFGPRGLASIVFAVMMLQEGALPHERSLLLAIVLTVGISVYAHGVSAGALTERYVAWFTSHPQDRRPAMESVSASEHRWRTPGAVRG
jgi:NhaP-type Na+/H+ or K+/H+ antiporter